MEKEYFESVSVPKAIAKFAVPTILSQVVTLLYNLADTFFVGHTGDPNQVAALTLSFPIFMMLTAIGNLLGIGANSLISRSMGAGEPERAKKASAFGFYGAIALTAVWSAALGLGMRPVLNLIGASTDTYGFTASYLTWTVVIGGVPTVCGLSMAHLVRAEGKTKQASIGMSMGGIINIILDPIFVFGLDLGIAGAAMATALSNTLVAVYFFCLLYRSRKETVLSLHPRYLRYFREVMSQVLLVGFPAALVILLGSSANVVLTHYMAPYGDLNVAAFGVVQKIGTITIQITIGITQGIMPLIGYNYGAGNFRRTKEITRDSYILLGVYCGACLVLIQLLPGTLIRAFIPEEQTVAIGVGFLRRWILCAPGMCFVQLFNCIFQAMGKWKQSMFLSLFRQGLLLIPLLIILNQVLGLYGLIWSQPIADTISLVVGAAIYVSIARQSREEVAE
jgi:putative MATE family efflux protein